jgi:hypothetical protein
MPDQAAEHFTSSLTLAPQLTTRPIAAYYLEKMGKPVPPPPKREGLSAKPAVPPVNAPLKPTDLLSPMIPGAGQSPVPGAVDRPKSDSPTPPARAAEPAKAAPEPPRVQSSDTKNSP